MSAVSLAAPQATKPAKANPSPDVRFPSRKRHDPKRVIAPPAKARLSLFTEPASADRIGMQKIGTTRISDSSVERATERLSENSSPRPNAAMTTFTSRSRKIEPGCPSTGVPMTAMAR
jgi:hypothetical protein